MNGLEAEFQAVDEKRVRTEEVKEGGGAQWTISGSHMAVIKYV